MLRTRQLRKKDDHEGLLKIFQLDQSARSVAREEGVRDFSWGEKLEGYGHCEFVRKEEERDGEVVKNEGETTRTTQYETLTDFDASPSLLAVYDGDQHYSLGPSTYIFADMMFFYLHRAVVPGCW